MLVTHKSSQVRMWACYTTHLRQTAQLCLDLQCRVSNGVKPVQSIPRECSSFQAAEGGEKHRLVGVHVKVGAEVLGTCVQVEPGVILGVRCRGVEGSNTLNGFGGFEAFRVDAGWTQKPRCTVGSTVKCVGFHSVEPTPPDGGPRGQIRMPVCALPPFAALSD